MLRASATSQFSSKTPIPTVVVPTLPILGTKTSFPIHRVYCVGQNYVAHANEMGVSAADLAARKEPFFFMKPADAVSTNPTLEFPCKTTDLQHEVELVAAIGKGGKDIPVEKATEHLFGFAVGLDMTKRDLQAVAKKNGKPWDLSKGFDYSAPCSELVPLPESVAHYTEVLPLETTEISLVVNGEVRQKDTLSSMIYKLEELISILSTYVELLPGDLIYTGTPAGVSGLKEGDSLEAKVEGVATLKLAVTAAKP